VIGDASAVKVSPDGDERFPLKRTVRGRPRERREARVTSARALGLADVRGHVHQGEGSRGERSAEGEAQIAIHQRAKTQRHGRTDWNRMQGEKELSRRQAVAEALRLSSPVAEITLVKKESRGVVRHGLTAAPLLPEAIANATARIPRRGAAGSALGHRIVGIMIRHAVRLREATALGKVRLTVRHGQRQGEWTNAIVAVIRRPPSMALSEKTFVVRVAVKPTKPTGLETICMKGTTEGVETKMTARDGAPGATPALKND
jgi:hypothetical protein